MNVVMLSEHDYAGSGWRIVQAIRKHTEHNIAHVKKYPHRYGYGTDFLLSSENKEKIQELLGNADIVHFKGDNLPGKKWFEIRVPEKAKVIVTVSGAGFRRLGKKSSTALSWFPISEYVKQSDFRTTLSPDLNYPELKGVYTPYAIDSDSESNCWKYDGTPVVAYYPGFQHRKGDLTHVLPAFEILKKMGYKFEQVPIEGVSYKESMTIKKWATVYIEQISEVGCYGNSGVEAMQFGIPVINYISERALIQSQSEEFRNSPILNPGQTVDGLVSLLTNIFDHKIDLELVSKRTKQYCDSFHGYGRISKIWDGIYNTVMKA